MGETGELNLQVGEDYVKRIAQPNHPERAVLELIWNSIDAEAMNITVELDRDSTEAIKTVQVTDDGHGISPDEVEATFGYLGKSWKAMADKTKNGKRQLHGRHGEGRLRVFAIGTRVEWVSVAEDSAQVSHRVRISGSDQDPQKFSTNVSEDASMPFGTRVLAHNDAQRPLNILEPEKMIPFLRTNLAPMLLNEPHLVVKYEGQRITAQEEIRGDSPYDLTLAIGDPADARLRIIEWQSGKHRSLHFGSGEEHFQWEVPGEDFEKSFPFSAYITWTGLNDPEKGSGVTLGNLLNDESDVGALWHAARQRTAEHFDQKRRERRREQIQQWKSEKIYPYKEEPNSEAEEAERRIFDVVSSSVASHIPTTKKKAKLTLHLLQNAVQHDPQSLTAILNEVVQLRPEERETLAGLLEETSLSSIIKATNLVASRHKFLQGLERMIFHPDDSGKVGERDHLHRILERELWVFGEEYHLMSSERSLTELLRTHLKLAGLPDEKVDTVRRWDGKTGRLDLHLATRRKEHDRVRNLVVELKAPDIVAKRPELDQIEDYANSVLDTAAFQSGAATYDFILVVRDMADVAERRISDVNRKTGQLNDIAAEDKKPRVRTFVRRWRDIIDENKRRLDFFTQALEHDPTMSDGLGYLQEQYPQFVPTELLNHADDGVVD